MKLGSLNHVAVLVQDLDAAIGHWERLGARLVERSHLAETQTDAAVVELGGKHFELLSSRVPDSRVGRLLRDRGEGIHHLSFEVEQIEERLTEAQAKGLRLLDTTPRSGLHGRKIAFLDPRDTSGTLIELVEEVPQPENPQR